MNDPVESWADLPGGEILEQGLEDLRLGVETVSALLIRIAAPKLARLGIYAPHDADVAVEPELRLYRLLRRDAENDAYGRYNAALRRLTSLCHALEQRAARRPAP